MTLIRKLIFTSAVILAVSASAIDQDAQLDILISKLTLAQKDHRYADALTAMEKIKELSNRLNQPLSEGFQYMYIDTLEKTENYIGVIEYTNDYVKSFGRKGAHYDDIIEKIAKYEDTVNKEANKVTFFDKSTGLIWQDNEEVKTVEKNWKGAIDYCENLTLAGRSDWQLPTKEELISLSTLGFYGVYDSGFNSWYDANKGKRTNNLFSNPALKNVASYNYWSSSPGVSDSANAWDVHFNSGFAYSHTKSTSFFVRCVRDNK